MGKPFKKELENLQNTIEWANQQPIDLFVDFIYNYSKIPLYIVGSGGSFSACVLLANLYQKLGIMAKAITPLEVYYIKEALSSSKILFISSSGKNTDILFAFEIAVKQEPISILTLCMRINTPLSKLAKKYSICNSLEYNIPTKKDGFLATNSLVAYYTIICRVFESNHQKIKYFNIDDDSLSQIKDFVMQLSDTHTLTVLYGGLGQSIAFDIESKFTEAALTNVSISDYRNFGHGRHHWFAKKTNNSAIVVLITPTEKKLAEKTISLIPETIPILKIESKSDSNYSCLELLIKSFYLVSMFGDLHKIDPGKPGVPEFGSKLYHLKYSTFYKSSEDSKDVDANLFIRRKIGISSIAKLCEKERVFWFSNYYDFYMRLCRTCFGIIVFDYDGTLCSPNNRYVGLQDEIKNELLRLLQNNIIIGIATGRGKSVRNDFLSWVPISLRDNVIIGYYNGSEIGTLLDDNIPKKEYNPNSKLVKLHGELKKVCEVIPFFKLKLKELQLSIIFEKQNYSDLYYELFRSFILNKELSNFEILKSSHSLDIIYLPKVSKCNIFEECLKKAKTNNKSPNYLCIGDKGKWPGNDFYLLACSISLSVDEVSSDPNTCWNLSSLGIRNSDSVIEYLKRMTIINGNMKFE
jgi:hypothetical protein